MYMFQVRAISVPTNPEDSSYRNDKLSGTVKTYPKKKPTIFSNNNQRWVSTHQGGHNCPVFYCVVFWRDGLIPLWTFLIRTPLCLVTEGAFNFARPTGQRSVELTKGMERPDRRISFTDVSTEIVITSQ